jgi:chromate transporter
MNPEHLNNAISTVKRPKNLRELFWVLQKLALQCVGSVLAPTQRVLVEQTQWFTPQGFVEAWAIAQVMPGPNLVNILLTYGWQQFGWRGAVTAVLGLLSLPFFIVILLAALYSQFNDVVWLAGALRGMAAVSAGLIIGSTLKLLPALKQHVLGKLWVTILVLMAFGLVALWRVNLSFVLLGLGSLSCAMTWLKLKRIDEDDVQGVNTQNLVP